MKVALVHYRIAHAGGLERRLLNYMHFFLNRGDEVTLAFAQQDPNIAIPREVHLQPLPVRHIPKPLRMGAFGQKVNRFLKHHYFDLDLSLGRTPGAQLLICPGNHRGFLHYMQRPWRFTDALETRLDVKAFRTARHILAASQMMKEELISRYEVAAEKITVLYPPSDVSRFQPALKARQSELRKIWGMSPDKKNFVFVSYSHKRKGLDILLKVFKRLSGTPFHLYIAGEQPKQPLPTNCSYINFIHDMPELYAAADVLIHPARYEPYGQIVTESLQVGTPVVVSKATGAGELLTENEGLVVPSQDIAAWEKAVYRAANKSWKVPPHFAERHGLTLSQHMERMLTVWASLRQQ